MTELQSQHLTEIFTAALERVDPYEMIRQVVSVDGDMLHIDTEDLHENIDLNSFSRIVVLGAGKAGAPMARAMEDILGERLSSGVVAVKAGQVEVLKTIELLESSHPVPDHRSVAAGRRLLQEATTGDKNTLFMNVISGGGSALLEAPRTCEVNGTTIELSLSDLQQTTSVLLGCGATIQEINVIRKHLSDIKGGRLAAALHPAHSISLILSDVVGDRLDSIASGLTVGDPTTFSDAIEIISRFSIRDRLPKRVVQILEAGAEGLLPETPTADDAVFRSVRNVLVGTNHQALMAAAATAENLGYRTLVLTSQLTGEARGAAQFMASIIRDVRAHDLPVQPPACLLFGGETTVTLRGDGMGGRNQELALALALDMAQNPDEYEGIAFLSGATDGIDGPTDAAGGFASVDLSRTALNAGLSAQDFLRRNDSYHYHKRVGSLLVTGPTNTNVCDIQIALIDTV